MTPNQSPLSATAPAFVPSAQSNRHKATDISGGDIEPVASTTTIAGGDRNGSNTDDRLNNPLPALRKAKMYSSSRDSNGNNGLGVIGGGGLIVSNIDHDENASPVPPSTKKSRPNTIISTTKVTVTGGGLPAMTGGIPAFISNKSITTSRISSSTPGSTSKKKRGGEKRVTISDDGNGNGIGYINGVAIGAVSGFGGSSSSNSSNGPGSKCFDIVDLNTKKSPSLGKYKKTPGPHKSAIALLDALDLSSPEEKPPSSPGPSKESSSSFRRTPGAGRKKNSPPISSYSTSMNSSRKRLLSTLSINDDDSGSGGVGFGIGGDDEGGNVEYALTPAERAKSRSLAKAALSATKTKLLQKAKDSGVLDESKVLGDEGEPIPIVLSAQSANGNYIGSNVTIALQGRLQSVTIEGLGDRPGTYRASNPSGLCLHLERDPIDKIIFGSASPLSYQPLSKNSTTADDSTIDIDEDDGTATVGTIGTIGDQHSWRQDISSSPLRMFTLASSNEKQLLSEPLRVPDAYEDNSLIVWTKEDEVPSPSRDAIQDYDFGDTDSLFSDDGSVAYEMPQEEEEEENGFDVDDEGEKGTGLTDTSLGNVNLSEFMPSGDDTELIQEDKTATMEEEAAESDATLGVSNCTGGGDTLLDPSRDGHDDDGAEDNADDGNNDDDDAATLLLSESGDECHGTIGTSSKSTTNIVSVQRDDSTIHMRSFLAGMATLFLAQVGMAFLGLAFFFFFVLIKSLAG